ncbi:MAG TPA: septum site-determining protein Ssd, partial [Nocardioides sp.]
MVVSRDPTLLAEVERLAAAAGTALQVVDSAAAAVATWRRAPAVLVGADLAAEVAAARPARRPSVHVVAATEVGPSGLRAALGLGAEDVVVLPEGEGWLVEVLATPEALAHTARTVTVVGAAGGVGATTLACLLGMSAGRDAPSLVVDLDPAGGGVDRVLGLEERAGIRWPALAGLVGRLSGPALR